MQYAEGLVGRVFVIRVEHGEDLLATIRGFASDKGIRTGLVHFLGALSSGSLVTGPEVPILPPDPHWERYSGGWECFGIATIFSGPDGPAIHYHGSVGRGSRVLTGCLRETASVYIVVEAIILEFSGFSASRIPDERTGMNLPVFSPL
jgi:predicted DNA-binding protein with PD1-like motif